MVKGQGQIFGAVIKHEICWVKTLTAVAGGSTGAYVVSPPLPYLRTWGGGALPDTIDTGAFMI